ncbi:hypothetical protein CR513_50125, partial [Mucuna pruriens]
MPWLTKVNHRYLTMAIVVEDGFIEFTPYEKKNRLTCAPILQAPNWDYPFELMFDSSNSTLGAVLG